ncbi:MAG TPA: LptA/OstA family protein [Candidatus Aminicenantes bacterium]|nr:LptA/OstA family protein [Candidatus Aminicenantes bacterium]
MSAQRASGPARFAAVAAAAVLVAVAAAVAVRLAGRRGAQPPRAPVEAPPPRDRAVDRKERVRHEEYEAGRLVADIRGDVFFRGPDGLNRLTGSVEAVYFGGNGETVSRLTAGEVAYAPGSDRFSVRGGVRVEAGDVALEGEAFEYDRAAGLFETAAGGRFASRAWSGSAPEVSYDGSADEVRLGGGFHFEWTAGDGGAKALSVSGGTLSYSRREQRGRAEGPVEMRGRGFRGAAGSAVFAGTPDEAALASAVLEGGALVVLAAAGPGDRRTGEIGADRIALAFSGRPFSVGSIEAAGDVRLSSRSLPGLAMGLTASVLSLTVDGEGGPPGWSASGGISAGLGGGDGPGRSVEGDRAEFDPAAGVVRVRGGRAVASSAEARVEAGEIVGGPGADDLAASGDVRCELRPGQGGPGPGIFADAASISVRADRAAFGPAGAPVLFEGNVEARSRTDFIRAAEIEFEAAGGGMRARRGVVAGLSLIEGPGGRERRIELGGRELVFSSETRALLVSPEAFLRLEEAGLAAGSVSAVLAPEGRAVASVAAAGGVTVTKGAYSGRAEAASYDPRTGRLVLTGGPVLTDGKGGSARGARLTFDLADDRILLENEGPGRTTTVIKS